jgi:hypothetical protein
MARNPRNYTPKPTIRKPKVYRHKKACEVCSEIKYIAAFGSINSTIDKRWPMCNICRDPLKKIAYKAVKKAVSNGVLAPISKCMCALCGCKAEAYHHDNYYKPLDVTPYCNRCHITHAHYGGWYLNNKGDFDWGKLEKHVSLMQRAKIEMTAIFRNYVNETWGTPEFNPNIIIDHPLARLYRAGTVVKHRNR